jgi:hypothetical protein
VLKAKSGKVIKIHDRNIGTIKDYSSAINTYQLVSCLWLHGDNLPQSCNHFTLFQSFKWARNWNLKLYPKKVYKLCFIPEFYYIFIKFLVWENWRFTCSCKKLEDRWIKFCPILITFKSMVQCQTRMMVLDWQIRTYHQNWSWRPEECLHGVLVVSPYATHTKKDGHGVICV